MESNSTQQQNLSFRAVTLSDLNAIVKLYQQQQTTVSTDNSPLTNHFGLPLYVAECNNQIIGYSYAATNQPNDYCLKTHIDTNFSKSPINESLMLESEVFFKNEWQNASNRNLTVAIDQLVNWLNNSNFQN